MFTLPPDVFYIVCEELAHQRDFGTLLHCALTNKTFARPAVLWLYRIYNLSTIFGGNETEITQNNSIKAREAAQSMTFLKWALLWKSIIRSSLGNVTAYPYCLYIRSLDLRNAQDLLDDPLFNKIALESFFADDMAGFLKVLGTPMNQNKRGAKNVYTRLDVHLILELIGESITSYVSEAASQDRTTVALEDISGEVSSSVLPNWLSRLEKLRSITLWDGASLNSDSAKAISERCYDFDDLTFYSCRDGADKDLASFFRGLRNNSLRSFTALGAGAIGSETLLSLNHHAKSLRRLKLHGLRSAANKSLSSLEECKALEVLEIHDAEGWINLEATENDIFIKVISWIGSCNGLRELYLKRMLSGPAILTQVCLKNNIRLQVLSLVDYPFINNQDFHRALSHQTSLESLELRADPEGAFRDDIDILISSLSKLTALKYLNLLSTSDYFGTSQILTLAEKLINLEELWFGGYDVTDDLWHGMANLPVLRALNIHAVTSFTVDSILAYISMLQKPLDLSIMAQAPEKALTESDQEFIRHTITTKIGGTFDFALHRDPDSESESFSD